MNRVPALNFLQGALCTILMYIFFASRDRAIITLLLFMLILISLFSISYAIPRRKKWAEILELLIYIIFFAFAFMGVNDLKSISNSEPVPNYFWIPWVAGLVFNWGELVSKIIVKLTERPYQEEE